MVKQILLGLSILLPLNSLAGSSISFSSPHQQALLLELYTSEGCSSCPPADQWLSRLQTHPQLWQRLIPVAFHVDYWNYLGWEDPFSRSEYTQRQQHFARFNRSRTVYTPGFLQNGKEWRAWFRNRSLNAMLNAPNTKTVGQLHVTIEGDVVTAIFIPDIAITEPLQLNVAWLGFGLITKIRAGENQGKTLQHDFVSLALKTYQGTRNDGAYQWRFIRDTDGLSLPEKRGVAFWLTLGDAPQPIQATGGWLP